jgi:tripartite-type tricarboxylate transporter receptor subunit TctC
VVHNTTVLVVSPERSPNSAGELAALAKEKPGQIPFASTGLGSMPHLALELFQSAGRMSFLHVPYRGAAPALNDLLGGQVQAFFADAPVLMPHIESGKIKALAVASAMRNPKLPNVPTLAEVGFPDTQADNWYGLLAPARTPVPVLARLHAAATAAINDPGVKEKLVQVGAIPAPTSPQEFGQLLRSELERWGRIVREKGIKE